MERWTGIVAALGPRLDDGMVSRLPTHLHPLAGRPLVWHAVSALAAARPAPDRILVLDGADLPEGLFEDFGLDVVVLDGSGDSIRADDLHLTPGTGAVLIANASAVPDPEALTSLLASPAGSFLAAPDAGVAVAHLAVDGLDSALPGLLTGTSTPAGPRLDLPDTLIVRDRASLAAVGQAVRDRLVAQIMAAGVTFLLPDTVLVDVDVRIGRDAVVYPGVIIEGQTTIGEETVIGPGCRIISSWIGSGVEMKGWNYIAHTSVRNRAILEPYVRRGFD